MAQTTVFEKQSLSFTFDEAYGCYMWQTAPAAFSISVGDVYRVSWDGVEYKCEAWDAGGIVYGAIAMGNAAMLDSGQENTGEPFIIACLPGSNIFISADAEASHTVAIYQGEASVAILLKDRDGNDVAYEGVTALRVRTSDGGTMDFVDALSAGSRGAKVAYGSITGNAASGITVAHGLGVTPDIIIVYLGGTLSYAKLSSAAFIGYSSAAVAALGIPHGTIAVTWNGNVSSTLGISQSNTQNTAEQSVGIISSANESTFVVGGSSYKPAGTVYHWLAIGGLF